MAAHDAVDAIFASAGSVHGLSTDSEEDDSKKHSSRSSGGQDVHQTVGGGAADAVTAALAIVDNDYVSDSDLEASWSHGDRDSAREEAADGASTAGQSGLPLESAVGRDKSALRARPPRDKTRSSRSVSPAATPVHPERLASSPVVLATVGVVGPVWLPRHKTAMLPALSRMLISRHLKGWPSCTPLWRDPGQVPRLHLVLRIERLPAPKGLSGTVVIARLVSPTDWNSPGSVDKYARQRAALKDQQSDVSRGMTRHELPSGGPTLFQAWIPSKTTEISVKRRTGMATAGPTGASGAAGLGMDRSPGRARSRAAIGVGQRSKSMHGLGTHGASGSMSRPADGQGKAEDSRSGSRASADHSSSTDPVASNVRAWIMDARWCDRSDAVTSLAWLAKTVGFPPSQHRQTGRSLAAAVELAEAGAATALAGANDRNSVRNLQLCPAARVLGCVVSRGSGSPSNPAAVAATTSARLASEDFSIASASGDAAAAVDATLDKAHRDSTTWFGCGVFPPGSIAYDLPPLTRVRASAAAGGVADIATLCLPPYAQLRRIPARLKLPISVAGSSTGGAVKADSALGKRQVMIDAAVALSDAALDKQLNGVNWPAVPAAATYADDDAVPEAAGLFTPEARQAGEAAVAPALTSAAERAKLAHIADATNRGRVGRADSLGSASVDEELGSRIGGAGGFAGVGASGGVKSARTPMGSLPGISPQPHGPPVPTEQQGQPSGDDGSSDDDNATVGSRCSRDDAASLSPKDYLPGGEALDRAERVLRAGQGPSVPPRAASFASSGRRDVDLTSASNPAYLADDSRGGDSVGGWSTGRETTGIAATGGTGTSGAGTSRSGSRRAVAEMTTDGTYRRRGSSSTGGQARALPAGADWEDTGNAAGPSAVRRVSINSQSEGSISGAGGGGGAGSGSSSKSLDDDDDDDDDDDAPVGSGRHMRRPERAISAPHISDIGDISMAHRSPTSPPRHPVSAVRRQEGSASAAATTSTAESGGTGDASGGVGSGRRGRLVPPPLRVPEESRPGRWPSAYTATAAASRTRRRLQGTLEDETHSSRTLSSSAAGTASSVGPELARVSSRHAMLAVTSTRRAGLGWATPHTLAIALAVPCEEVAQDSTSRELSRNSYFSSKEQSGRSTTSRLGRLLTHHVGGMTWATTEAKIRVRSMREDLLRRSRFRASTGSSMVSAASDAMAAMGASVSAGSTSAGLPTPIAAALPPVAAGADADSRFGFGQSGGNIGSGNSFVTDLERKWQALMLHSTLPVPIASKHLQPQGPKVDGLFMDFAGYVSSSSRKNVQFTAKPLVVDAMMGRAKARGRQMGLSGEVLSSVCMQFGRRDADEFHLAVSAPFSPLQAFTFAVMQLLP